VQNWTRCEVLLRERISEFTYLPINDIWRSKVGTLQLTPYPKTLPQLALSQSFLAMFFHPQVKKLDSETTVYQGC
jgi:hypothetical protein